MKRLDLESAQRLVNDPQAIKRGYLSAEILADAERVALAAVQMPNFGKTGHLVAVGFPENYWAENCPGYAEITQKYDGRQHSCLIQIAEAMIREDRREIVESRWASLELLRKKYDLSREEREEYNALSQYLGYPAKT